MFNPLHQIGFALRRLALLVALSGLLTNHAWADTTFAHLSDTHLMRQGPDGSWLLLKDAPALLADMLAQLDGKAQFVVITGNVVHNPDQWDVFAEVARQSRLPIYVALGNRDVANGTRTQAIARLNQLNLGSFAAVLPDGSPAKGYYSFSPKPGVKLLMLDTAGNYTGKGQIDPEQQAWLKQQLAAEAQAPAPATVIVAMHHPLLEPYASPSRRLPDSTKQAVLAQLEQSPLVSMVLSGAYHAAKIQRRNGIVHISTPALVEYPLAGRLITVKDDGHLIAEWLPSRLRNLEQLSRSRSPWVSVATGNPSIDHAWHGGLRYYPTPMAVARLKTQLQPKTTVKTATSLATSPVKPDASKGDIKAWLSQNPAHKTAALKSASKGPAVDKVLPKPAPVSLPALSIQPVR